MFSAAYTVDAEGMTTYWRKNTYRLLWTDCIEFEIVQVPVNWSTSAAVVYCSTRVLSQKEKETFIFTLYIEGNNYIFIQVKKEFLTFQKAIAYINLPAA